MNQREFIYAYNDQNRPKFNPAFFYRSDEDIIQALIKVIYSCERSGNFVIKVIGFEIIDNYDDINHVLWEYEERIINKGKLPKEGEPTKKNQKKQINQFAYINLNDSDLKLIKVTYYIQITEKKNGLVSDTVTSYIAIPRIVDGFYFRLNGNMYSAMYQIVDASTYNNSASRNAKKQSITFKTIFTPIRVYRYTNNLVDIEGKAVTCSYFVVNMFKKSVLLIKYLLAHFGMYTTQQFLCIEDIFVFQDISSVDRDKNYIFPVRDMYIVVPKIEFDSIQICQSYVYTLHSVINYMADQSYADVFDRAMYIKALGAEFTMKDISTIYDKGLNILGSLDFIYDQLTKEDLKLPDVDKADAYAVLRWMMYEFNSLRQKDNLDISTKKIRYAEYIASYYATKMFLGICRVSDKGERADLNTIRKAIQIPPMYLINAIIKCELVNYRDSVNDLDALIALKYTYKGVSGIGEKRNAISGAYRSVHPSHLGRVDIDSSSNTDPGVSGTICPLVQLYDGHFTEYEEPHSWHEQVASVLDTYRNMKSKKTICRLIDSVTGKNNNQAQEQRLHEDIVAASKIMALPNEVMKSEEYINGYDIFGDGYFFWIREDC